MFCPICKSEVLQVGVRFGGLLQEHACMFCERSFFRANCHAASVFVNGMLVGITVAVLFFAVLF